MLKIKTISLLLFNIQNLFILLQVNKYFVMTDDKTIKLIAKKLKSDNANELLFTIKQIRNTGDPKILPHLFELLANNKSEEVNSAIIGLLNDLKNKDCRQEVIKALKNDDYYDIHKEILTTCWQSGLDYSKEIALFVNFFAKREFEVAFEAFTIIDTFEEKIDQEIIKPLIKKLKSNIDKFKQTNKEGLFIELIHILERLNN